VEQIHDWVKAGYRHLENGELTPARQAFLRVIEAEEENLRAWWGLAHASESVEDQIVCLENVLTLDPDHKEARERLSQIRAARGEAEKEADPIPEVGGEKDTPPLDLEDELACPFCGRPTEWDDRTCETCDRRLWVKERKSSPIPLYWTLGGLELVITLIGGLIPLLLFSILDRLVEGIDPQTFIAFYLDAGPTPMGVPLSEIVPPDLVWLSLAAVAISLPTLLCSISRWAPAYWVGSGLSALRALVSLSMIVIVLTTGFLGKPWEPIEGVTPRPGDRQFLSLMTWGVPAAGALIAGLSALSIWAMMRLNTHFHVGTRRMLLNVDPDVAHSEEGLWLRARKYAQRQTWALTVIHLREALASRPTVERYLLLATAYYHLDQRNRARLALSEARTMQPDHPRIAAMIEQIDRPPEDRH